MASTTYDEIPYDGQARYHTHPDRLATMATLMGLTPAAVDCCRVLEIGCGTGGNLIPMAAHLPNSRFIGIDYSARHIQSARTLSNHLGLPNIEWIASDIREVGAELGLFDYILCHGVYSWVPAEVQDHILKLCKALLNPSGVAYISYNTYPGWHLRGLVREAAKYHVSDIQDPQARVPQARAFLRFLLKNNTRPDSAFGKVLEEEQERWNEVGDYYLFHEHLEENNTPVYFHEFARRAAAVGLQYLGEAWQHSHASDLSAEAQEALKGLSADLIQREQYLDFLRNRTFRRTLLVHDTAALDRTVTTDQILLLRISALAYPAPSPPGAASDVARFQTGEGVELMTSSPFLIAMLTVLYESLPDSLTFDELIRKVELRMGNDRAAEVLSARIAESAAQLFLTCIVGLHHYSPELARGAGEYPKSSALARLQAKQGLPVTNLCHGTVKLPEFDRRILSLLDGRHGRSEIVVELLKLVADGEINLAIEGRPLNDVEEQRALLEREIEHSLRRLARAALLSA